MNDIYLTFSNFSVYRVLYGILSRYDTETVEARHPLAARKEVGKMSRFIRIRIAVFAIIVIASIGMFSYPYVANRAAVIKEVINQFAGDIFFMGLALFMLAICTISFLRGNGPADKRTHGLLRDHKEGFDDGSDIINDPINASLNCNIFHDHQRFGKHT